MASTALAAATLNRSDRIILLGGLGLVALAAVAH
jgi:hypothetical protein